ncbi:unnamed protein product [Cylindrotheca closterium]|uniref:Uncharacterized protein n=1 Tax=Cylindrotheca closterium TaxID=2856 RepID=A0AAD2JIE1_9STRA|nr:unnamed protein product [Cylindrotheca closterium]
MKTSAFHQIYILQLVAIGNLVGSVLSFVPRSQGKIRSIAIHSYDPYQHNDDHGHDPFMRNKERTDIRNLLTQRSLQSFVFLLNSVRDVHTAKWLEKVFDFKNLDNFHGTGALNITKYPGWDSPFLELITMDSEVVVVETSPTASQNRRRGWSNKAGYLDNLSQKKQLDDCFQKTSSSSSSSAKKKDEQKSTQKVRGFRIGSYLDNLGGSQPDDEPSKEESSTPKVPSKPKPCTTPKLRASSANYLEGLSNGNAELPTEKKEKAAEENPYLEEKSVGYEIDIDPASLVNRIISVREQISKEWATDLETLFLTNDEILTSYLDQQMDSREQEEEHIEDHEDSVKSSFNSSALFFLTNSLGTQDRDSSPFRRSNFDLLLLLSTQESIHRVLRDYSLMEDEDNFDWLMEFYTDRVSEFFDGHGQAYGRADDFLKQLIESPPVARRTSTDDISFVDPMKMIEDIIRERSEVAREWKEVTSSISHDHTDLRRLLLTRRMIEADDDTSGIRKFPNLPKNKKNSKGEIYEAGVFE